MSEKTPRQILDAIGDGLAEAHMLANADVKDDFPRFAMIRPMPRAIWWIAGLAAFASGLLIGSVV